MSKCYVNTIDDGDSHVCVICGEYRDKSHKCTKEGEARFNRSQAAKQSASTRIDLSRYGVGLCFAQKIYEAFTVFNCGGIRD